MRRVVNDVITPGAVYQVEVELFPTANVFKRGHRIRVDISSIVLPIVRER